MKISAIGLVGKLLVLTISIVLSLVLAETVLRIFYPVYEYAAEFRYDPSTTRIWRNHAGGLERRRHPDTGARHWLIHNRLGSRQHRDISDGDLAGGVNVAFFGDSFTENRRLPASHSFTEVLDYLLNLHEQPFNVLNFGVDGYGTDQSFLAYEEFRSRIPMQWVFYLLVENDLENIERNELFALDGEGDLNRRPAAQSPWYIRAAARLHLTYLLFDVRGRLDPGRRGLAANRALLYEEYVHQSWMERFEEARGLSAVEPRPADQVAAGRDETLSVFRRLLEEWQRAARASAARFVVAGIPREQEHGLLPVVAEEFETLDLFESFHEWDRSYEFRSVRFASDGHWNERGNMLAALTIYRFLEERMGLERIAETDLLQAAANYYAAFPDSWQPGPELPQANAGADARQTVRERYLALELKPELLLDR